MNIWSKGFLLLWAGLAVAGGLLIYLLPPRPVLFAILCLNANCTGPTAADILKAERPQLASGLLEGALFLVCLAGLWLVSSRQLRVAFLLLAASIATSLFFWAPAPSLSSGQSAVVFFLIPTLLRFPTSFLTLASLVLLTFGIARWRRPGNVVLVGLQALLALGMGAALVLPIISRPWTVPGDPLNGLSIGGNLADIGGCLVLVCLLVRWEGWKQRPLVIACLLAGQLAALISTLSNLLYRYGLLSPQALETLFTPPLSLVEYLPPLFFLLGVLLLIQSERVSQQTQLAPTIGPSLALGGGGQEA